MPNDAINPTPIARMTRDIASAAKILSDDEARFLVDAYYQMQGDRIRAKNQAKALEKAGEPNAILDYLGEQSRVLESQVKRALDKYTEAHPCGEWMRAQKGIGPVIAAGMLAHIDIHQAPTVGHVWRFAGLDPTVTWEKGQKRPWNAKLKTLCWKAGESFVKVSGDPEAYYGQTYAQRKAQEVAKNEAGDFAEQAAAILEKKRIGKDTEAYKAYSVGKLPPAHIHARAQRYAVKLFLAHLHEVMHETIIGTPAPLPYPIAHLGHVHKIERPA